MKMPDVDIDVKDREHALEGHVYVKASLLERGDLRKHNTGVFYQSVPEDPITGLSAFPSGKGSGDMASFYGFFKMDLIPNHAYSRVVDPAHLDRLLATPVDWSLFTVREVVESLHQLGNSFDIVDAYEPKSVEDLACLIALIRPGKRHLMGQEWDVVRREVWVPSSDEYFYKKSHAVAFAMCIIVQLNSMIEAGEIK